MKVDDKAREDERDEEDDPVPRRPGPTDETPPGSPQEMDPDELELFGDFAHYASPSLWVHSEEKPSLMQFYSESDCLSSLFALSVKVAAPVQLV